jgi:hypothetical protein
MPAPAVGVKARERRRKRSRGRYVIYFFLLFILCLAITIPATIFGYPYVRDYLAKTPSISSVTETPSTLHTTITPKPIFTQTPTPTARVEVVATDTNTVTVTPTPTLQPTTAVVPATLTSTPTSSPTATATNIPAPLLDDNFSQGFDQNTWQTWGLTESITVTNGEDRALLFLSVDVNEGGVSSIIDNISFEPGLVISFTVNMSVDGVSPTRLRFAWTPGSGTPLDTSIPLPVEFLIDPAQVTINLRPQDSSLIECNRPLTGPIHNYRIEVLESLLTYIYIDENQVCVLTNPPSFIPTGGRIHFSGSGLVDNVYVILMPSP